MAKVTALDKNNFEVRTVIGVASIASKLLPGGHLNLLDEVQIFQRKEEIRWVRCWNNGHKRTECTGSNREEGRALDSPNKGYCTHCGEEDHQTGSFKKIESNSRHRKQKKS